MKHLLPHRVLGAVILVLLAMPMVATGAPRPSTLKPWAQGWIMVGHDPQRTGRSPGAGPLNPHLLWSYRGLFGPEVVGPDGSVYGWSNTHLVALTPQGQPRWTVSAQEGFGGPPALGPDGLLRVSGQLAVTSTQSNAQPHLSLFAVSPQGQLVWTIKSLSWGTVPNSVPFSKSQPPLVTAANVFYVPFVGPSYSRMQNNGAEAVSADGVPLQRLFAGYGGPIAVAPDGTVYLLGYDYSGRTALLASKPDGTLLWNHYVTYSQSGGILVGQGGTLYLSDSVGYGPNNAAEVAAYTPAGQLQWHLATNAGVATLAERGDGVIMVADGSGLTAISTQGKALWHRALGKTPSNASPPSLAVDATGHAFAGSADGMVRGLTSSGSVLWTLHAGGPSRYTIPTVAIGANGLLEVTGTDNVVRAYH